MRLRACRAKFGTMTNIRSWDDMNYDILVNIMRRVPWAERLCYLCMVSKTWFSAILDTISPPGVINLKLLDSPRVKRIDKTFCLFLKRRLDSLPPDSCLAFYQGVTFLKAHKYRYIGERTPSMQKVIIPPAVGSAFTFILPAMKFWKKLEILQCPAMLISSFRNNFTEVKTLRLFGVVDDVIAAIIRINVPDSND